MAQLVITIDGPAGSGKSTVARRLAERLDATFLDTGAMYRAVTLAAVRDGADLSKKRQLLDVVKGHRFDFEAAKGVMLVRIDGCDVTEAIRDNELTAKVRYAAAAALVRTRLVEMQRAFAARHAKVVTEGRDQGTVAFPDARVKFYLTADAAERARRRVAELRGRGVEADFERIRREIESRDESDENRDVGPLKPAADAITVDTTDLSVEQVVDRLCQLIQERTGPAAPSADDPLSPTADSTAADHKSDGSYESHASRAFSRALMFAWYWLAQLGCRLFCVILFRFRAYGQANVPAEGPVILASNHQSFLDPVFCGVPLRRHLVYVARDTLFRYRLFAFLIRSLNAIPIGRDKADIAAMRAIIARLREGAAVCLYPEGTRTRDGRVIPVKPGFGLLCRRAKAVVVPVLIDGGFEVWPRHRRLFEPGAVTVVFGRPISPAQIETMSNEDLADHLTRTLRQMQRDTRCRQGKPPYNYDVPPATDA
jgi:cytidylate kinase